MRQGKSREGDSRSANLYGRPACNIFLNAITDMNSRAGTNAPSPGRAPWLRRQVRMNPHYHRRRTASIRTNLQSRRNELLSNFLIEHVISAMRVGLHDGPNVPMSQLTSNRDR